MGCVPCKWTSQTTSFQQRVPSLSLNQDANQGKELVKDEDIKKSHAAPTSDKVALPTSEATTAQSYLTPGDQAGQNTSCHDLTSPVTSAKILGKDSRTLSTCRLKRFAKVTDHYEITKEVLGTGISGAVCVVCHKDTNRRYAMKTLSLEGVNLKKAAMLHNEVSIYLQLDHPNIAKLIEIYETEEAIHLIMELCTGGELYHRLASKKKYNEADAANVTQQMLAAINYCHKHNICHRDLKLENWVYADLSPDAPLKLIDFGFSRIFNSGIPMTAMHGTVYYVSPEVMDGCYKEKCDIWSIGVIVYMLLSGSPPFNGSYDHEILVRIKRAAPSFEGSRWEGISENAKSFLRWLLQKDPDIRPSAEEALAHPWLQCQTDSQSADIDVAVLKSMRNFALCNILKRAALNVVALSMTSREVLELENAFRGLDREKKGTISLQSLASTLIDHLQIEPHEAQRIFSKIDQTGSQEVHYTEFIASTLQAQFVKDESLIQEAFKRFDVDHTNRISLENVRSVLGDVYDGTRVEDILALCDVNKDGYLDFDEFKNALTTDELAFSKASTNSEISDQVPSISTVQRKSGSGALTTLQSMRRATWLETDMDRANVHQDMDNFRKRTGAEFYNKHLKYSCETK